MAPGKPWSPSGLRRRKASVVSLWAVTCQSRYSAAHGQVNLRAGYPIGPAFARRSAGRGHLARKNARRSGSVVTIHDVARHAGVSPMTVSRVINSESNVRDETRARVAASVKALRYSPN